MERTQFGEYNSTVDALIQAASLNPLGPGDPNREVLPVLDQLTPSRMLDGQVADEAMARCCLAGLWLLHNFLDESHRISQEVPSTTGSYWHGIMHRREPDYSNAKYWFRRVGDHAIYGALRTAAQSVRQAEPEEPASEFLSVQSSWDPFHFVDLCEAVARGRAECEMLCRQIALREWQLLFHYCYHRAGGVSASG